MTGVEKQILGGPIWFVAQMAILLTIALALFVTFDALRGSRKAAAAGRLPEPLWVYSVVNALYLLTLLVVQFIPGLQVAAAVPALGAPLVLVLDFAYLLRVVFPKPTAEELEASAQEQERKAQQREQAPVESEDADLFDA